MFAYRAPGKFHLVGQQQLAILGTQHRANPVFLQKMAEIERRGAIGSSLTGQVNSTEITKRSDIVERLHVRQKRCLAGGSSMHLDSLDAANGGSLPGSALAWR